MNIETHEQYYRVTDEDGFVNITRRYSKFTSGWMSKDNQTEITLIEAILAAPTKIFSQRYCGEELCDVGRDVSEAFDRDFNPNMNEIPLDDGIDKGTFTVTITWEADS